MITLIIFLPSVQTLRNKNKINCHNDRKIIQIINLQFFQQKKINAEAKHELKQMKN